jgi:predicted negative regulator of RcsB-dependent stress response
MFEVIGWIAFFVLVAIIYYFFWKYYQWEQKHSK